MFIELEAVDGSRATQTLFQASEIKVVKLVLGTTTVFLTTQENGEGSKSLNVCLCGSFEQQGSVQPLQPAGIEAADSLPSDGSPEEPVAIEGITKEFVEKLRGWMIVLASLFASMMFQAGINPPRQLQPDITGHGAQNPVQLMYQGRLFFILNSIVFSYSLVLVMLMLFQSSLSVERLVGGKRGFLRRSKRGLLCGNIFMLLVIFGLGSANHIYDMVLPLFYCPVLLCTMCYENIRDKCKEW